MKWNSFTKYGSFQIILKGVKNICLYRISSMKI